MRQPTLGALALSIACFALPCQAASPTSLRQSDAEITFEQYRDFRLHDLEQREARLARRLAAADLSVAQKERLEQTKAYYDRLVAMSPDERDRLFRLRFDAIDANHDGKIDAAERSQWREKQRDRFRQQAAVGDDPSR
jgi:hypothetical protein